MVETIYYLNNILVDFPVEKLPEDAVTRKNRPKFYLKNFQ